MAAIVDYRGKTPRKTSFGIPLITAKVVKGGRIEAPDEFIATDDYGPWMRRGIPEPGDVLVTTEAPLGEVAQLRTERVALAQRLIALRGKPDVLDNTFLKFLMQSADVQNQLRARATGTTVLGIKQSELRKISLTLPPITEQRAIAHILGTLDDKIELNRRMNETLEAIARVLFKSWFVNFDPVRAKAESRDPGLPKHLADLFPDSFAESELGEIPVGWRAGKVGDLAILNRDGLNPVEFPGETFDHFSIPAFDEGHKPKVETAEAIKSTKLLVPSGAVLLSKLNPRIPRVWLPNLRSSHRTICSTEFLVILPQQGFSREFVFCLLSSDAFASVFATLVTGTSGSHQRVNPEGLLAMDTVIPPGSVRRQFTSTVGPMLERVNRALDESSMLAALRAALLPKLVSGELRVKRAHETLETAL